MMDIECIEALVNDLKERRNKFDKGKLEQLIESNNPKDKKALNSMIIDILECDDTDAMEIILANEGIDFNAKDYEDNTCLSVAVSAGSIYTVKLLLDCMTEGDVRKYNDRGLLNFRYPNILPNLWLVEDIVTISHLLLEKKINLTLEHKLAILEFLVHNTDDCDCASLDLSPRQLRKNIEDLVNYGSPVHVGKVINKIKRQIADQIATLGDNVYLIECVAKPLSPGIMFKLYVDEGIRKIVNDMDRDWENYFICESYHDFELELMKSHKLRKNNRLSLYDVLTKNPSEAYRHISKFDCDQLSKKYKFAGDYIKGLKARSLIRHQVEEFLPDFMKVLFPLLPDICFIKIFSYLCELSNEDILAKICHVAIAKEKIPRCRKVNNNAEFYD